MIPNKMVAKRHSFFVQGATSIFSRSTPHSCFPQIQVWVLDTLIPTDIRWYQSIIDFSTAFFSAVNSGPNVEVFIAVCSFHDHVVGVDPTTENNPVIDLPVTLSCPWLASINTWIYNSPSRGSEK